MSKLFPRLQYVFNVNKSYETLCEMYTCMICPSKLPYHITKITKLNCTNLEMLLDRKTVCLEFFKYNLTNHIFEFAFHDTCRLQSYLYFFALMDFESS